MNDKALAAGDLDAQELLHLALKAMEEDRDAEAIGFLKRGIALEPEDGRTHYLLGAMHAQLGMFERAVTELQHAVRLAPHIDMAHFQLGLLQLTSGDVDSARQAWAALSGLDAEHPLTLFSRGMLHLAADQYDDCIACLRRGIELNTEHDALNRDMVKVIEAAEKAHTEAAGRVGDAAPREVAGSAAQHVLLAGYRPRSPGSGIE